MKPGTVDKMIERWESLGPAELQSLLLRLVEQKGVFQQVFEVMKEGIILFDTEGQVTFANKAAGAIFGMDSKDMRGEGFSKSAFGIAWGDVSHRVTPVSQEMEISYPEHKFLHFYLMPIGGEGADGEPESPPVGYVLTIRDITHEHRRTEEQIESEKLNALTLLAAGVAHEIGNPLNSLGLHLQLLGRKLGRISGPEVDDCREYLGVAESELKRLDLILKQFLNAIRPQHLQKEMCSLNRLLEETVHLLAPEMEEKKIQVILDLEPHLPQVALDPVQIRQVFYNLIKNAYQAIPNGGGSVTLRTYLTDNDFCVDVSDTGTGISHEAMGTLFEPFHTTKKSGNGLGLLIVRRIIRDHGGSLRIASEPGEGTQITVQIPRAERMVRLLPGAGKGGPL